MLTAARAPGGTMPVVLAASAGGTMMSVEQTVSREEYAALIGRLRELELLAPLEAAHLERVPALKDYLDQVTRMTRPPTCRSGWPRMALRSRRPCVRSER